MLVTELVPPEVTSLGLVLMLAGSGVMTAEEAFRGFASEAIVVLACVMILSRRLSESGAMHGLSSWLAGRKGRSPAAIVARLMASSAALSMVFSNTSTTAVMMPIASDAADKAKVSPGRFMMPMAFASMMGGCATLIGTSANIAANGVITRMGLEPFHLFEFFWVGIAVTAAGIVTVVLLGNHFIPERERGSDREIREDLFLADLIVVEGSKVAETALGDLGLPDLGATPLAIDTEEGRVAPHGRRKVHAGDHILVHAAASALARLAADDRFHLDGVAEDAPAEITAEAILLPGSRWTGLSVAGMRRRLAPDVSVVGVRRAGYERVARVGLMRLRAGDILFLAGNREGMERVDDDVDIYLSGRSEPVAPSRREGWYTLSALFAAIAVSSLGLLPMGVALLSAVMALVLAGRFTLRDAFSKVSWHILILIGGMSGLGLAMLQTGAADWLAEGILHYVAPLGQTAVLIMLSLLTILLTQALSNAAAALTVLPVAVAIASGLGVDPRPLAVIVTLSASLSFIAPLEPALLLVYGKGHYRLRDFILAGVPLTAVSVAIVLLLVPMLWPL
nr:SLC13 family permease [Thalassovita aquimarina]